MLTYKSDGTLNITVTEDDEWRLSSEFQRHLLHIALSRTASTELRLSLLLLKMYELQ